MKERNARVIKFLGPVHTFFIIIFLAGPASLQAQITAQGQGGRDGLWMAAGIEQKIGARWTNKNAIAYSRHSSMDNLLLFDQSGIFTVREEVVYKLSEHFKISQGVFYAERGYYDLEHPVYLNEVRFYPRFYHEFSAGKIKFSQYLRFDFRIFSGPGFHFYTKPFEFRTRYCLKVSVPLDKKEEHFFTGISEIFFATDDQFYQDGHDDFTPFHFTENRTSLYYRRHFNAPDMFFDAGIMFQTWKDNRIGGFRETVLFQVDVIFINPFKRKKRHERLDMRH